jgi:hypothetical protein
MISLRRPNHSCRTFVILLAITLVLGAYGAQASPPPSSNPAVRTVSAALAAPADAAAWHLFDTGSWSTAYMSVGSNNGTISGATWTSNANAGCVLSCNGASSYASASSSIANTANSYPSLAR